MPKPRCGKRNLSTGDAQHRLERTILVAIILLFATGWCYEWAFKYSKMKTNHQDIRPPRCLAIEVKTCEDD